MKITAKVEEMLGLGCRIDDLQMNGLTILQHPDKYCFSTDPVILANFARVTPKTRCVDLGSGSGIIATLLVGKYNAARCDCVEIQPFFARMSEASAEGNGLQDRIRVHCMRMQDAHHTLSQNYDLAVSNPPFNAAGGGEHNMDPERAIARHEVEVNLEELIASAARLVKFGGNFCLIHQSERLAEICCILDRYGFAAKRIRLVEGRVGAEPALVLIEAKRGAKSGVRIERNLGLYYPDGTETDELKRIYSRNAHMRGSENERAPAATAFINSPRETAEEARAKT